MFPPRSATRSHSPPVRTPLYPSQHPITPPRAILHPLSTHPPPPKSHIPIQDPLSPPKTTHICVPGALLSPPAPRVPTHGSVDPLSTPNPPLHRVPQSSQAALLLPSSPPPDTDFASVTAPGKGQEHCKLVGWDHKALIWEEPPPTVSESPQIHDDLPPQPHGSPLQPYAPQMQSCRQYWSCAPYRCCALPAASTPRPLPPAAPTLTTAPVFARLSRCRPPIWSHSLLTALAGCVVDTATPEVGTRRDGGGGEGAVVPSL